MAAQSTVAWAILSRGRIDFHRRYITEDRRIAQVAGASHAPTVEAMVLRERSLRSNEMGGPIWQRKADCQRFCNPDEQPVRVRLFEVST